MIAHARILVIKENSQAFDMSTSISRIVWRGRKGAATRTLELTFIDDDGYKRDRSGLDVEEGHAVIFYWKEVEMFRGVFKAQTQTQRKSLRATAYDMGIRLSNNRDTFCYSNKTASNIFRDVCNRFSIPLGDVASTQHVIPELPKPRATGWDVVCDALALTFKATGVRYFPKAIGSKMHLLERRLNMVVWVIETGVNLTEYELTKSTERVRTRIVLLSSEGEVLAQAQNDELEAKLGTFQEVVRIDDEMNTGQLEELVNQTLTENNQSTTTLTVSALGQPDVTAGCGVAISINPLDISKVFYVESDSHVFEGRQHLMTLTLVPAHDAEIVI